MHSVSLVSVADFRFRIEVAFCENMLILTIEGEVQNNSSSIPYAFERLLSKHALVMFKLNCKLPSHKPF